jgi:hypothetical protein
VDSGNGKAEGKGTTPGCTLPTLPYGIAWEVCCVQGCGKILGAFQTCPEWDGYSSHSYCEPHGLEAAREWLK